MKKSSVLLGLVLIMIGTSLVTGISGELAFQDDFSTDPNSNGKWNMVEQTSTISELAQNVASIDNELNTLKVVLDEIKKRAEQTDQITEEIRYSSEELARIANMLQGEVDKYQL